MNKFKVCMYNGCVLTPESGWALGSGIWGGFSLQSAREHAQLSRAVCVQCRRGRERLKKGKEPVGEVRAGRHWVAGKVLLWQGAAWAAKEMRGDGGELVSSGSRWELLSPETEWGILPAKRESTDSSQVFNLVCLLAICFPLLERAFWFNLLLSNKRLFSCSCVFVVYACKTIRARGTVLDDFSWRLQLTWCTEMLRFVISLYKKWCYICQ